MIPSQSRLTLTPPPPPGCGARPGPQESGGGKIKGIETGRFGMVREGDGGEGVTGASLATEGELREGHGLVRETLRGQHGEGVTCREKHCTLD